MKNVTLKVFLKPEERKTDKTHLVMVRITKERNRAYYSLGIYIGKSVWNKRGKSEDKNWVKPIKGEESLHEHYNELILNTLTAIRKAALKLEQSGRDFTAADVKDAYLTPKNDTLSFLDFFAQENEKREQQYKSRVKSFANWRIHNTVHRILKKYHKDKPLPFKKVNVSFLEAFRHELTTVKGLSPNTASDYLNIIKINMNLACKQGYLSLADNPFIHIDLPYKRSKKEYLTLEELIKLRDVKLEEPELHHARNAYLLQFLLHGARIGDVLMMRNETIDLPNNRIKYLTGKSKKWLSIAITDPMRAIILQYLPIPPDGFLLPILTRGLDLEDEAKVKQQINNKLQLCNKYLKLITERLGIKKHITTHTARHTFANLAVKGDINPKVLQSMLGHSSLNVTQGYMADFREGELDTYSDTIYVGF